MTGTASRRCPNQPPQAADRGADSKNKRMVRREPTTVLDQRFTADNLSALRSAVIAHAAALVNDDTVEEMVVVSHELDTNVVLHGGGARTATPLHGRQPPTDQASERRDAAPPDTAS